MARSLKSLTLGARWAVPVIAPLPFPWHQLSDLTLTVESSSLNDTLDALGKCASLLCCVLWIEGNDESGVLSSMAKTPTLDRLIVKSHYGTGQFLGRIVAPKLRYLSVECDIEFSMTPDETRIPFESLRSLL